MQMRYKPSKPVALLSVPFGIGMIAFALTSFDGDGQQSTLFLAFWCVAVVAIVAVNLWAAFSPRGATGVISRDES